MKGRNMKLKLIMISAILSVIISFNTNAAEDFENDMQKNFVNIATKYRDSVSTANNDLQVRLLFKKRTKEFNELNFNGDVSNWSGKVKYISATGDTVYFDIEIAPKIIFTIYTNIEDPIVGKIANLNEGQKVIFSGNLTPAPGKTGFYERSMTTRGSLEEPEFKFELTDININNAE